jgi:hypothetical protein
MTTIILTIIGILLAAAAALMVIFYGGDAFNAGSIGAQANTLQNAGTNVISAVQLSRAESGLQFSGKVADLVAGKYLKEVPSLTGIADASVTTDEDIDGTNYVVSLGSNANADAVCARVNKNLKLTVAPALGATKMGCATGNVFFASL